MKKCVYWVFAILLVGCTGPGPTGDVLEELVTARLLSGGNDKYYEVDNVHMISGEAKGDAKYVAEIGYDLRFKVDLDKTVKASQAFVAGLKPEVLALSLDYGAFRAGDMRQAAQKFSFAKGPEGWTIKDEIGRPGPRR